MALTFLLFYFRSKQEFNASLPVENEKVNVLLKDFKLRRKLRVRHSDRISSPLAYGIFRPVILLPSSYLANSEEKEIRFILTHEFVHICRFDAVKKLFCVTALCLHWFNPLVWLMFFLFNRDMELACDEGVLRQLGVEFKTDYAAALIRAEAKKSGLGSLFSNFAFKKGAAAEERIKAIMKTKKHTVIGGITAALLVCGSASVFASSPAENTDKITSTAPVQLIAQFVAEDGGENDPEKVTVTAKSVDYCESLERFKPFGLEVDENGVLYYEGKRVRFFSDSTEIEEDMVITNMTYIDEAGEIDIHSVYEKTPNADGSSNPFGKLVGIEEYKKGEVNFPAILSPEALTDSIVSYAFISEGDEAGEYVIEDDKITFANGNGGFGGMTLAEIFAQYKEYGVAYDESTNNLYYNGELVRYFIDLSETGVFTFSSADQSENIVLRTVYDDNGKLCGVKEVVGTEISFDLVETVSMPDTNVI